MLFRLNFFPNLHAVLTETAGEPVDIVPLNGLVLAAAFTDHGSRGLSSGPGRHYAAPRS
jgi:hypothetical protein